MSEKVYLANGKKFGEFGTISTQVELDKIFKHLSSLEQTNKTKLGEAFKILLEETKDVVGFSQFKRNDGKIGLAVKIDINEKREAGEFYGTLNTWVSTRTNTATTEQKEPEEEENDDLPF